MRTIQAEYELRGARLVERRDVREWPVIATGSEAELRAYADARPRWTRHDHDGMLGGGYWSDAEGTAYFVV